ncbi:MAG: adenylosuccinate synthase [Chloroflexi bacterium]|nr:adenylosuccinate synthase [Chloroflexota bacterium]OJV92463.1 MAG: adenylosuccinate synthase [Chloroflexi bacterium 54-19]
MSVTAIVGAQWGDEGKGKFVDILAADADLVVRYNGGNNAGHTIVNEYGTFKLHLVPSGIFHQQAVCIIGPGVVIDLPGLVEELREFEAHGINFKGRLFISPRCHLILPYHRALDRLYEEAKGRLSTGTTGRGIGPAYADKAGYNGIRLSDLARRSLFLEKLGLQVSIKNRLSVALGGETMSADKIASDYLDYYNYIQPFVRETFGLVQDAIQGGKRVLLEGAQAALLDPDWGGYPFVTASTTLVSAATAGAGVPGRAIERIIGVAKAYTTRVGNGPFPTELTGADGEHIRKNGQEYGTTTGRPRRCGWFDTEVVRFAAGLNGFTELALTKLDVFDDFETIQLATGYEWGGKPAHYYDGDAIFLEECQPTYESWPGWQQSINAAQTFEELPENARKYLQRLEAVTGLPASFIGVGPRREETIIR